MLISLFLSILAMYYKGTYVMLYIRSTDPWVVLHFRPTLILGKVVA